MAKKMVEYARFIPGIRLIALTGSVAVNNSQKNDDLDLLIVTDNHCLWLVRPVFLLLLSLGFTRRHPGDTPSPCDVFCPNLWLETKSLSIPKSKRNLYTAHEVLQIKPLLDRGDTYEAFIRSNSWVSHFLANAYPVTKATSTPKANVGLFSLLFWPFNYLSFLFQYLYMLPKKTSEYVTLHSAFFHTKDLSPLLADHLERKKL